MKTEKHSFRHWSLKALVIIFLAVFATLCFAELDVTNEIGLEYARMMYNRRTGQTSVDVALQNIGQNTVSGPLKVVIDSISNPAVTVVNADGEEGGKPFFLYDVNNKYLFLLWCS